MATTTKHALRKPVGTDTADVPRDIGFLADDVDGKMSAYAEGTIAARPAPGTTGRWYRQTDGTHIFMDTGAGWIEPALVTDPRVANASVFTQGAASARPAAGTQGRMYFATDTGVLSYDSGTAWTDVSDRIGDMKASARTVEHAGWIFADGRTLAAGQYPHLRALLIADGSPHGSSGGSPFLPDLRGRVPMGAGTPVGATGATAHPVGQKMGHESHQLSTAQIPAHAHSGTTNAADRSLDHLHTYTYPYTAGMKVAGGAVDSHYHFNQGVATSGMDRSIDHLHTFGTQNTGGDGAHPIMQPSTAVQWFVHGGPAT